MPFVRVGNVTTENKIIAGTDEYIYQTCRNDPTITQPPSVRSVWTRSGFSDGNRNHPSSTNVIRLRHSAKILMNDAEDRRVLTHGPQGVIGSGHPMAGPDVGRGGTHLIISRHCK